MALVLDGVSKSVGTATHIYPTDLRLERGALNVLLGPTLSGKTTLMRLMAGLDRPTTGRVVWDGEDVTGMRVQKRNVAMVYQQFINYPTLTVYENIASPMRLSGASRSEIDAAVHKAADLMKLGPMLRRRPLELSGGQQQRCALARALVKGAELVLLDEPLANLDYKLREELREEIPRIFAETGAVFVYATTEPHEALLLGGNTATLWEGRVTQYGPTPRVYRAPADATTAQVFSDPPMNFLDIVKTVDGLRTLDGAALPALPALDPMPEGAYRLGFRANHLGVEPGPGALGFRVTVAVTEVTGSESLVHIDHGTERWVMLVHGLAAPAIGERIEVHVDLSRIYVFDEGGALVAAAPYAVAA